MPARVPYDAPKRFGTDPNHTAKGTTMGTLPTMAAEDFDRLLGKAFMEDVRILPTREPHAFRATSGSEAGVVYRLTVAYCSCDGHRYHGRCKHRARLAFELGQPYVNLVAPKRLDGSFMDWRAVFNEAKEAAMADLGVRLIQAPKVA